MSLPQTTVSIDAHRAVDDAVYRNILVVVRDAASAGRGLAEAAELARRSSGRITVLVRLPSLTPALAMAGYASVVARIHADAVDSSCAAMRAAVAEIPQEVPVTTMCVGDPFEAAVCAHARAVRYDVVVMDVSRAGRFDRARHSSGRYLRRHCDTPLWLVGAATVGSEAEYLRVVHH